ncbi:hypothetical protein ABE527_05750 [Brucella sp. TWI432]
MEIKVLALRLCNGHKLPDFEIVAHADLEIGGELLIRDAALASFSDGYRVLPPKARSKNRSTVVWRKGGALASTVNNTVERAYRSMTGQEAG